jgi:MOSC domain-containing protein YiiM
VGVRLAEPCAYLEGLVGRPILAALAHRAGLRADILQDGEIAVGDEVVPG